MPCVVRKFSCGKQRSLFVALRGEKVLMRDAKEFFVALRSKIIFMQKAKKFCHTLYKNFHAKNKRTFAARKQFFLVLRPAYADRANITAYSVSG